jgi:hypothetical protein
MKAKSRLLVNRINVVYRVGCGDDAYSILLNGEFIGHFLLNKSYNGETEVYFKSEYLRTLGLVSTSRRFTCWHAHKMNLNDTIHWIEENLKQ